MTALAEQLVALLFDGTLPRTGQRDWDIKAAPRRIQVKALWDVGRRTRRRLGTIGTDLDLLVAVVFDEQGRVAEVWEVDAETLVALRGKSSRPVVRLRWVRVHGRPIAADKVLTAARRLGLEAVA